MGDRKRSRLQSGGVTNPDVSVMVALPEYMKRPPGKRQLTIDEVVAAQTPTGYSEQTGHDAFLKMLGSAVAGVTGHGKKMLSEQEKEARRRERLRKRIQVRVPGWIFEQLSAEQKQAVELISNGESFVLLGKAGTGKTFTLVEGILAGLHRAGVNVMRSASTGKAATALGGSTIHSLAGMGLLSSKSIETIIKTVVRRPKLRDVWKRARVLVIDEFTMLSEDDMRKVETVARVARKGKYSHETFGGMAVILCGDPCQLQCVDDEKNSSAPFYMSPLMAQIAPHIVYLRKVYRQRDVAFCNMLEDVRKGLVTARVRAVLDKRLVSAQDLHSDSQGSGEANVPVHIYARRASVSDRNGRELAGLPGRMESYTVQLEVRLNTYKKSKTAKRKRHGEAEEKGGDAEDVDEFKELVSSVVAEPKSAVYDRILAAGSSSPDGTTVVTFEDAEECKLPEELAGCRADMLDTRDYEATRLAAKVVTEAQFAKRLDLKIGAPVMLIRNIPKMIRWGFVNGLTGKVVGFTPSKTGQRARTPCPPPPRGTINQRQTSTSSSSSKQGPKVVALGPEDIVPPSSTSSSSLYNLTERLAPDQAVVLGIHPWQVDATSEQFDTQESDTRGWPVVEFMHVGRFICKPMDYEFSLRDMGDLESACLYAVQIPIVLCSAMTVHKVQGMTLSSAVVHLDSTMNQHNQAYVALSRVQNESGLLLSSLEYGSIRADPRAVQFMDGVERCVDSNGVAKTEDVIHLAQRSVSAASGAGPTRRTQPVARERDGERARTASSAATSATKSGIVVGKFVL